MIWCDLHLGQMTLYQGQHTPSASCTTFVPSMGLWYFFAFLYRSMNRRQESDAAMLRLIFWYTIINNTELSITSIYNSGCSIKFIYYITIHSLRMIERKVDCAVKVNYDLIWSKDKWLSTHCLKILGSLNIPEDGQNVNCELTDRHI